MTTFYVYDTASKILYCHTFAHFLSKGTFDNVGDAQRYLLESSEPFGLGCLQGKTLTGDPWPRDGQRRISDLHRDFDLWMSRTPCPSHSAGTWGYDKECLLPKDHAGEHKHGTVGWEGDAERRVRLSQGAIGATGPRASADQVMLFIEMQASEAAGGQDWLVSRCVDQRWTAYFTCSVDDHQIDQLAARLGYLGWAIRCRSGGIRCSNAAHLNVHALLDKVWHDWTHACSPAPAPAPAANAQHCMVPHPTSEGPCMNPSGHPGPHRALSGFEWHRAGTLSVSNPDPRPDPEGLCSFCAANPANHWGSNDWKICASADCSAAHHFHEERCQSGSVDTPETRAESLRYGRQWLLDQAFEDAQKKPEGSCGFCPASGNHVARHPDCIVPFCSKHEREAWRLTHRIELGGVCDTPQLREEVLRHVAASDAFLREKQCEERGARTERDYVSRPTKRGKKLSSLELPHEPAGKPSEEIPLVGTTPHYEWP